MEEKGLTVRIRSVFLAGIILLVPSAITIAVLLWIFNTLDGLLGPAISLWTGWQVPGLGLMATLVFVFLLGIFSRNVLGRRLVDLAERLVQQIPVVRSLYASTKGVLASLADRPADAFKRVVLFEYPLRGIWSVGFVTGSVQRSAENPPSGDLLTIFVPTTPNPTSGFLVLAPRDRVTELVISVEEGIRLVISGGILRPAQWSGATAPSTKDPLVEKVRSAETP